MALEEVGVIRLSDIRPPRYRLRKNLGEIEELKKSIEQIGLLHPITIRWVEDHYEVVSGHRRYVCMVELGRTDLRVGGNAPELRIVEMDDKTAYEVALTENIQRKEMEPLEEASCFKDYIVSYGWGSVSELAHRIDRSPTFIDNRLNLLKLSEETFQHIRQIGLSTEHSFELSRLSDSVDNKELTNIAEKTAEMGLDSGQTRKVVNLVKMGYEVDDAIQRTLDFPELGTPGEGETYDPVEDSREQIQLSVDQALGKIDNALSHLPEGEEKQAWIKVRFSIHQAKDSVIKLRKKYHPVEDVWK